MDQLGGDGGLVSVRRTKDGGLGGWTGKDPESGVTDDENPPGKTSG